MNAMESNNGKCVRPITAPVPVSHVNETEVDPLKCITNWNGHSTPVFDTNNIRITARWPPYESAYN